jgi:hypothetical protein
VKPGRGSVGASVGGGVVGVGEDDIVGMGFIIWASIFAVNVWSRSECSGLAKWRT